MKLFEDKKVIKLKKRDLGTLYVIFDELTNGHELTWSDGIENKKLPEICKN